MPISPLSSLRRLDRRVVAALLLALAQIVVTAPAAAAASPSMASDGKWRECTKTTLTGCATRGTITKGTGVTMKCWIDDSNVTEAYKSNRWFYVTSDKGVRGFVHSSRVKNQVTVKNCKDHNGIAPARWAAMQVGETKPSASEASALGIYDNMWSGWCQAFAGGAYHLTGYKRLVGYASAAGTYNEYNKRGLVTKTSITAAGIDIGSLVYYPTSIAGGYGHVAVYVGNGYVVSTQGLSNPALKVARLKMDTWGNPIGWVKPAYVDGVK